MSLKFSLSSPQCTGLLPPGGWPLSLVFLPAWFIFFQFLFRNLHLLACFPDGSDGKESACSAGDPNLTLRLGRSPGEGNGNPLQYSCIENPMDRGAWRATVPRVAKSWTRLSNWVRTHKCFSVIFPLQWVDTHRCTWPGCSYPAAAAAAKSLQSCRTLCNPIDGSPPGSSIPGILQARTLEWVAISFSNAWKWKVKVKSLSHVLLLATPWTAAYQAPPSMGFSRQEYWSGVPLPSLAAILLRPKFKGDGDVK